MAKTKLVMGVGIMDIKGACVEHKAAYTKWSNMIKRSYDRNFQSINPTYIGCTVSNDWLTFSNFLSWFNSLSDEQKGYSPDKDILFPGNKEYSAEKVVMIPRHINLFVTDRARDRGEYPLGVTLARGRKTTPFLAQVSENGKQRKIGYFDTPEEAHEAWRAAKLDLVHKMENELNAIDPRLYPALVALYS